ncbi:hypothetical protein [Limibacterium fermenti]|uniref:hypothetical protein n=1 Tax=Limibacterium fermenti TaxID=3229863 RepID=UPI003A5D527B
MGILDFGTKAQVEELAFRIGVGMQQIERELITYSNQNTPTLRGLALALMQEKEKMSKLISFLTPTSREKLKVRYNNEKISYLIFIGRMKQVSDIVDDITGINFFNSTREVNGQIYHVKS